LQIRPVNILIARLKITALLLASGAFLSAAGPLWADDTAPASKPPPIRITADNLVTDNQKQKAEFSGNVRAVQKNTVITTDRLTLFYGEPGGQSPLDTTNSIERMEANGNVRIEFDNKVAVSNQAVYIIEERKLVLSGPESKVVSGLDEISGSKITFYRDSGQVALEGDGKNRVKAIIHPGDKGLH
jgi:lipopolysaccharide export system protein LptA